MARIKVRYLIERPGAGGSVRRFWSPTAALKEVGWRMVRLPDDRQAAIAEAEKLNAELDRWRKGELPAPGGRGCPRAGTVAALIAAYRASDHFRGLKPSTRRVYEFCLELIDAWAGPELYAIVSPVSVQTFYRELARRTPSKAALVVRVIQALWKWGRLNIDGFPPLNPAADQSVKGSAPGTALWEPEDVEAFVSTADRLGWHSIGTAVTLNEWLGQREGDILNLPRTGYANGTITVSQSKRGAVVELPVDLVPRLRARLEAELARQAERKLTGVTLLLNDRTGLPWAKSSFVQTFAAIRKEAAKERPELAALTFMRLRHTAVTRLEEAGANWGWIASVTGHTEKSIKTLIDTYRVRTKRMARQAFALRLEKEGKAKS